MQIIINESGTDGIHWKLIIWSVGRILLLRKCCQTLPLLYYTKGNYKGIIFWIPVGNVGKKFRYLQTHYRNASIYDYYHGKSFVTLPKRPRVGNNGVPCKQQTKRRFYKSFQERTFYVPERGTAWMQLWKRLLKATETINKTGITAVLKKAQENGMIVNQIIKITTPKINTKMAKKGIEYKWLWSTKHKNSG